MPLATERTVNTGSARGDQIVDEWLGLYPMPNRQAINTRRFQANVPFTYDTPNVFGRMDYNWSNSTRLMGRYDFRNQDYKITRIFRGNGGDIVDRAHTGGATLTRMFSPTTLGEFRFGYAYRRVELPTEEGFEDFPTDHVTGFGTLGSQSVQYPISRQLYDLRAPARSRTAAAATPRRPATTCTERSTTASRATTRAAPSAFGVGYGRSSIENFLAGTPTTYTLTIGDPRRNFRVWDLGVFVQDDIRLRQQPDAEPRDPLRVADRVEGEGRPDHVRIWRPIVQARAARRRRVGRQWRRHLGGPRRLRVVVRPREFLLPPVPAVPGAADPDDHAAAHRAAAACGGARAECRPGAVAGRWRKARSIPISILAASTRGTRPSSAGSGARPRCVRRMSARRRATCQRRSS